MVDKLRHGAYKALILDTPTGETISATDKHCELFVVGDSFEHFDLGLAFSPDFPDASIAAFSKSIVGLQVNVICNLPV